MVIDKNLFIDAARNDGQKIERLIRQFYSRMDRRDVFIDGGAHLGYHRSFAPEVVLLFRTGLRLG